MRHAHDKRHFYLTVFRVLARYFVNETSAFPLKFFLVFFASFCK